MPWLSCSRDQKGSSRFVAAVLQHKNILVSFLVPWYVNELQNTIRAEMFTSIFQIQALLSLKAFENPTLPSFNLSPTAISSLKSA